MATQQETLLLDEKIDVCIQTAIERFRVAEAAIQKFRYAMYDLKDLVKYEEQQQDHQQHHRQRQRRRRRRRQHPEFEMLWKTTDIWQTPTELKDALLFLQSCRLIRRNDPHVWHVRQNVYSSPQGYGIAIGDALCDTNNHVSSVTLDLDYFLGPFEDEELDVLAIRPMQQFLATSTALRFLELHGLNHGKNTDRLMNLSEKLLTAASVNPNLEYFSCQGFVSPRGFHTLLSKSTSLQELDFCPGEKSHNNQYSLDERNLIVSAFQATSSIQNLIMRVPSNWNYAIDILSRLTHGEGSKITELNLDHGGSRSVWPVIELYLETTATLQHLTLRGVNTIDGEYFACLLRGLRSHFSQQHHTPSITKLSLSSLTLTRDATDSFIDFMQAPVTNYPTDKNHFLRELSISQCQFDSYPTGSVVSSIVSRRTLNSLDHRTTHQTLPDSRTLTTMGSALTAVSMRELQMPLADFFRLLQSDVSISCLPRLILISTDRVNEVDNFGTYIQWFQLSKVLPELTTLRELHFEMTPFNEHISFSEVIAGFRSNGCICATSITCPQEENCCRLFDRESRLLKAYSRRNEQLPKLFSNMPWSTSTPSQKSRPKETNAWLFPSLLQAAKQVKLSRESTVFSRLVESGQVVGPSQEPMKRSLDEGSL